MSLLLGNMRGIGRLRMGPWFMVSMDSRYQLMLMKDLPKLRSFFVGLTCTEEAGMWVSLGA